MEREKECTCDQMNSPCDVHDTDWPEDLEKKPTPFDLWCQAEGDGAEYERLLRQHGLLIERAPDDDSPMLPCGWPEDPERWSM